jgi:predicted RNase H-like nuclease
MVSRRGPDLPYKVVAGVTPWRAKWLVASAKMHAATFAPEPPKIYDSFLEVLNERPQFVTIVVNAPIGVIDSTELGVRSCDRIARSLLGRRGAAVHNAPTRDVLTTGQHSSGDQIDAVTKTLLPAYRELASEMSPYRQRVVYEGNPELSFYQLNSNRPLRRSKKIEVGRDERRMVLVNKMPGAEKILDSELRGVPKKHLFDAAALLWTARRVYGHAAIRIPSDAEWDSEGMRMEFVY